MENQEIVNSIPTIIFSNYWLAKKLIEKNNIGKIYSISLSNPKGFEELEKVRCFCPNWKILTQYKEDKDWDKYTNDFIELVKENRKEIRQWIESLDNGDYYLCCWENTVNGAKCHRKILFELLSNSATMRGKAIYQYLD